MREAAAAEEALLIDFNATEAGKMGGAGPGAPFGWVHPGQPAGATGGPPGSWMPPPHGGYAPFPGAGYGPMDSAMSPPPPYGYPLPPSNYQQPEKPPRASAPHTVEDQKQKPSSFNIPPNNLGADSKPSSKDNSPTGNSKPLNTNLQVNVCILKEPGTWIKM